MSNLRQDPDLISNKSHRIYLFYGSKETSAVLPLNVINALKRQTSSCKNVSLETDSSLLLFVRNIVELVSHTWKVAVLGRKDVQTHTHTDARAQTHRCVRLEVVGRAERSNKWANCSVNDLCSAEACNCRCLIQPLLETHWLWWWR